MGISAMIHRVSSFMIPVSGKSGNGLDFQTLSLLGLALVLSTAPLDVAQLTCALLGAVAYAVLQSLPGAKPIKVKQPKRIPILKHLSSADPAVAKLGDSATPPWRRNQSPPELRGPRGPSERPTAAPIRLPAQPKPAQQPSAQPIKRPSFTASGWDAEVQELLEQIRPGQRGEKVMKQLSRIVRQHLQHVLPNLEVMAFASADFTRGTAFGVAVPEVEIVVNATPETIFARLHDKQEKRGRAPALLDMRKLHKSAIRVCTDRLVSSGGFKFRRSAFRGGEPKVTLLAPASLGIHDTAIPLDLSVNSTTPLYNAALLTECGCMEPRARDLVLLVKRWAKDRGICHAAKGHLPPYVWTLLTIYFLQTRDENEGPLLPPLSHFQKCAELMGEPANAARSTWAPRVYEGEPTTVGALFQEFMRFYTERFDWRHEAVSVRLGRRCPPDVKLPLHVLCHDDGKTSEMGMSIEDPFARGENLGACLTIPSLARLHEELARAVSMNAAVEGASLAVLLEPWVPADRVGDNDGEEAGES